MAFWFTADLHLGHPGIIGSCRRPFDCVADMNAALIGAINAKVDSSDVLYMLGDFSCGISARKAFELRELIGCRRIHLVPGNHDKDWARDEVRGAFVVEPAIASVRIDGIELALCHYPLLSWPGMHRGAVHLHGHVHGAMAENEKRLASGIMRYDVGVDANAYAPISLDGIVDAIAFRSGFSNP